MLQNISDNAKKLMETDFSELHTLTIDELVCFAYLLGMRKASLSVKEQKDQKSYFYEGVCAVGKEIHKRVKADCDFDCDCHLDE